MMGYRDIILNDGYTIIPEFLDRADLKKVVDLERNTSPWKGLHNFHHKGPPGHLAQP